MTINPICGHLLDDIASSREGTCHCRKCEEKARNMRYDSDTAKNINGITVDYCGAAEASQRYANHAILGYANVMYNEVAALVEARERGASVIVYEDGLWLMLTPVGGGE